MSQEIETLKSAVARWNAGDLDGYMTLYAPDIRLHGYTPEPMGRDALATFYRMVWDTLHEQDRASPRLAIEDFFADGPRLACRATISGHHMGPFLGAPASGRPYVLPVITLFDFRGGRAVERWSSSDMLGLAIQIGAVAPPMV